jgi:hypothetical protein
MVATSNLTVQNAQTSFSHTCASCTESAVILQPPQVLTLVGIVTYFTGTPYGSHPNLNVQNVQTSYSHYRASCTESAIILQPPPVLTVGIFCFFTGTPNGSHPNLTVYKTHKLPAATPALPVKIRKLTTATSLLNLDIVYLLYRHTLW